MLEHPDIARVNRTGYPFPIKQEQDEMYGNDALGNEVLIGDEILVLDDEFYLVEELTLQSREILEGLGASYKVAA